MLIQGWGFGPQRRYYVGRFCCCGPGVLLSTSCVPYVVLCYPEELPDLRQHIYSDSTGAR